MDKTNEAFEEELLRRRNAKLERQLLVRDPMKGIQQFTKLLAEILTVRR